MTGSPGRLRPSREQTVRVLCVSQTVLGREVLCIPFFLLPEVLFKKNVLKE